MTRRKNTTQSRVSSRIFIKRGANAVISKLRGGGKEYIVAFFIQDLLERKSYSTTVATQTRGSGGAPPGKLRFMIVL